MNFKNCIYLTVRFLLLPRFLTYTPKDVYYSFVFFPSQQDIEKGLYKEAEIYYFFALFNWKKRGGGKFAVVREAGKKKSLQKDQIKGEISPLVTPTNSECWWFLNFKPASFLVTWPRAGMLLRELKAFQKACYLCLSYLIYEVMYFKLHCYTF